MNQPGSFQKVSSVASVLWDNLPESGNSGNIVFSPFGIYLLLAALNEGASGKTAEILSAFLGIGSPEPVRAEAVRFFTFPSRRTSESLLTIANLFLIKNTFNVSENFLLTIREYYRFYAERSAFDSAVLTTVNKWASENTGGRINEVLRALTPDEVMVLVNSILFTGQWETPFQSGATRQGNFTNLDGTISGANMMFLRDEMEYYHCADYSAVRLKYTGGRFSMIFLLPEADASGGGIFSTVLSDGIPFPKGGSYGELRAPRIGLSNEINADEILKKAGLANLFSPDANLTGINPDGMLNANRVIQRNSLSVDEAGTIAASVTAATVAFRGMNPRKPDFSITCDRTYYLLLRDEVFGVPLIAARVAEM
ncbi:MAG: serpin family protein [Brevinematales bacterium]|nr:serpin family protein [Brevinematales bacterium]